jgi:hypothetical protein
MLHLPNHRNPDNLEGDDGDDESPLLAVPRWRAMEMSDKGYVITTFETARILSDGDSA